MAKKKTTTRKTTKKAATKGSASTRGKSAKKKTATKSTAKTTKKKSAASKTAASKTAASKTAAKKSTTSTKSKKRATTASKRASSAGSNHKAKSARVLAGKNSKPKSSSKRLRATAGDEQEAPPRPMPKTRLNDKQLNEFKTMLLGKRSELLSDVRMLTKDALGKSRKDSAGDLSSMPIHMADIGSDNWEQDFTLGLIANERQLVREIDDALERIENRTYGICIVTHKPITVARLRAKPWAKYCIEYARQLETRGY